MRKKISFLIFLLPLISNGQNNKPSTYSSDKPFSILWQKEGLSRPEELFTVRPICEENPIFNCNLILNNNFTPNTPLASQAGAPFNRGWVPNWYASHGTAQLYDYMIPRSAPGIASGFGFMGGISESSGDLVEGIAQRIPTLSKGENYLLSFYKAYSNMFEADGTPKYNPRFKLKIELMYCPDFLLFPEPYISYEEPSLQNLQHQTIYCEVNPSNLQWQQTAISFIPDNNYNIILITPSLSHFYSSNDNISYGGGIVLGYPELINVTSFSAGLATPIGNCMVSIGPATPNCSVTGAVFNWSHTQLNGSIVTQTAPPNQQIQIDASNPNNVGTWTLTMSAPSAVITNNSCSQNEPLLSANVNVPATTCERWPKAYATKPVLAMRKTDNGNILVEYPTLPQAAYLNHIGPYPPMQSGQDNIHYSLNGITNWHSNKFAFFTLHNGTIQMSDYNYYNSQDNTLTTGPSLVPSNESIVAETSTGDFITATNASQTSNNGSTYYSSIYFRSNTVFSSSPINLNNEGVIKFNPLTNKLYIISQNILSIYDITNTGFNLISTTSFIGYFAQVSSNDKVYIIKNSELTQVIDNGGGLAIYTTVVAAGFNNTNLGFSYSSGSISNNPYVEDRILVMNVFDNYLYSVDLMNLTSKKILLSNSSLYPIHYVYNNDDVYVSLTAEAPYSIGTQVIQSNGPSGTLCIFTKLNIVNDFSYRSSNVVSNYRFKERAFSISIFPNPTTDQIKLEIISNTKEKNQSFTIIFKNLISNTITIKQNYISNSSIDISTLERGQYFVEVINVRGEKAGSKFLKL